MNHVSGYRAGVLDRVAASLELTGKLPGWQCPPRVTVKIAEAPVRQALHFKNAKARADATRAMNIIKLLGDKVNPEQVDKMLRPFVHHVPIYRGALKSVADITMRAIARQEKANVT